MRHLSDKASILAKETQHQTTNYPFLPNNSSHNYLFLPRHRDSRKSCNKGPDPTWKNHLLEQERPKSCQIQSWQPRTSLPCKANPMVCFCISVTKRYWASCKPASTEGRKWHFRASLTHVGIHSSGVLTCAPLTPRIHMLNPNRQYLDCNHIWRQVIKEVIKLKWVH